MTVLRAELALGRGCCAVGILHLVFRQLHIALAAVHYHVRFRAQQLAEAHELVHAEIVVFDAFPRGILARRSAVGIAQAVAPIVTADEVARRATGRWAR